MQEFLTDTMGDVDDFVLSGAPTNTGNIMFHEALEKDNRLGRVSQEKPAGCPV